MRGDWMNAAGKERPHVPGIRGRSFPAGSLGQSFVAR